MPSGISVSAYRLFVLLRLLWQQPVWLLDRLVDEVQADPATGRRVSAESVIMCLQSLNQVGLIYVLDETGMIRVSQLPDTPMSCLLDWSAHPLRHQARDRFHDALKESLQALDYLLLTQPSLNRKTSAGITPVLPYGAQVWDAGPYGRLQPVRPLGRCILAVDLSDGLPKEYPMAVFAQATLQKDTGSVPWLTAPSVLVVFVLTGRLADTYQLYPDETWLSRKRNEAQVVCRCDNATSLARRLLRYQEACRVIKPDSMRNLLRQTLLRLSFL